jgi:Flp pilus assembly protein TadG
MRSIFRSDESGSVIPLFAVCALVIFGAVGVAIDYSRAALSRSEMQAALDAASIMLAKEAANLTEAQLNEKAQGYFLASFKSPAAKNITVTSKFSNVAGVNKISLEGTGSLDTTVFNLFGTSAVGIRANSEVTWECAGWSLRWLSTIPARCWTAGSSTHSRPQRTA